LWSDLQRKILGFKRDKVSMDLRKLHHKELHTIVLERVIEDG
jgi:hypothetical protein